MRIRNFFNYKAKAIISVIGGFILHLVVGEYYLWGNINIYFTSYYRLISEPDLQTSKSVLLVPIIDFIGTFSMFMAPIIISKIGLRPTVFIMGMAIAVNLLLCSFMPNFISFMLLFGIVFGFAFGVLW